MAEIASWKHKYPMSGFWAQRKSPGELVQPQAFLERLDSLIKTTEQSPIITAGVGQHQMWAAQHIQWKYPRSFISSGGLGTMGFGLPAAIGAKIARPEALVINIDGDASLSMTINELLTASQYNLDVKTIVLNNEEQGMVTHLQTMYFGNRYAHSHGKNADFVHAAQSMGVQAKRCASHDQVDEKLGWLLKTQGPALLEVMITQKALSLPVVPAGCALHEFITYSADDIQLSAPLGK
jgi:acetolactate synthase-1/2/3 large subunit